MKERHLERVHEKFRVIALGLPVPKFRGNPLDPPIRSRFQARQISGIPFKDLLEMTTINWKNSDFNSSDVSAAITYGQVLNTPESLDLGVPLFPEMSLLGIRLTSGSSVEVNKLLSWLYPYRFLAKSVAARAEEIAGKVLIPEGLGIKSDLMKTTKHHISAE